MTLDAAQARQKAGLTLQEAADRARVCVDYLRRLEKLGGFSWPLAQRLARVYGCGPEIFLTRSGRQTPTRRSAIRVQIAK